ncbi:probable RNA helicase SDE3 isoform X2 [Manihot esculenta]|nr:probable RNA helicase SDE3 isoform X2 [Manihot esculenta]XP_021618185.1 probable RNA helicase SDE3 isoform X2 [Manihot esculenta]XP_043814246.1 probable RNA helicase SDE3 isoform X2 [Manihot esculenta]KAG8651290.1 hypothetical protein MANES_07G109900v8 [Manihot esculenta]OAY46014.1 hypothetical protein MANES_07G109900v8 [Manihot esculenta]
MSLFLEILRGVLRLIGVGDHKDEKDEEASHGNTSRESRLSQSIFSSSSTDSANNGSTYVNSVERIYDVSSSSNSHRKYVFSSSHCPETFPSWLPPSSSSSTPSKPSPQAPSYSLNPSIGLPKPAPSSSTPSPLSSVTSASSFRTIRKEPPSSSTPSLSSSNPPATFKPTFTPASSNLIKIPEVQRSYYESSPSPSKNLQSFKPTLSPAYSNFIKMPEVQRSCYESSPSPSKNLPSFKPTLAPASSNVTGQQTEDNYVLVQKDAEPIYMIPKDIQDLIKKDMVPGVLKKPLSMSTYKDYFAALLYAEDFYIEKWSKFKLVDITLKLQKASVLDRRLQFTENDEKHNKTFVTFEIDSCCERRPFLLSRDFVFARPSGNKSEPFQGLIYRVARSTTVLVEFGDDFHAQHHSSCKYDVSFSFNRVCLKRAHQAIEAASNPSFKDYIFPDCDFRMRLSASSPSYSKILSFHGPPPYLIEGPLCVTKARWNENRQLSETGLFVQESVLEIYQSSQKHRVLICAPINSTCDLLTRSLKRHIPESDMFRANAAFREIDGVPTDILSSCVYKGECFSCPRLQELQNFRVILSTYVSSFRLCNEGIAAGHFSHIFLMDASSATEPEAMVALANLANKNTTVVVTGAPGNYPAWVRSDIARKNGLKDSYFKRLRERNPYSRLDPMFIKKLVSFESTEDKQSFDPFSFV